METRELIAQLSREAALKPGLRSPAYFGVRLILVLVVYGIGIQFFLDTRPDIAVQLARPMFAVESVLLLALTLASAAAAIYAMYPDAHQRRGILRLPYVVFALLGAFVLAQLSLPQDARMTIPLPGGHGMECALCIGAVSLIPSGLTFALLRKGASVHPLKAGSFAVLAASGLGCLTLRLAEANDSLAHVVTWHYLPTLLFAASGALAGRYWLRW